MVSKKNNPLFVWGSDRRVHPLGSLFVVTWQASWCQTVILGMAEEVLVFCMMRPKFLKIIKKKKRWWARKIIHYSCIIHNPFLGITICHHSASLVMPNGDPQDGFYYPTLALIIDSYNLGTERKLDSTTSDNLYKPVIWTVLISICWSDLLMCSILVPI